MMTNVSFFLFEQWYGLLFTQCVTSAFCGAHSVLKFGTCPSICEQFLLSVTRCPRLILLFLYLRLGIRYFSKKPQLRLGVGWGGGKNGTYKPRSAIYKVLIITKCTASNTFQGRRAGKCISKDV